MWNGMAMQAVGPKDVPSLDVASACQQQCISGDEAVGGGHVLFQWYVLAGNTWPDVQWQRHRGISLDCLSSLVSLFYSLIKALEVLLGIPDLGALCDPKLGEIGLEVPLIQVSVNPSNSFRWWASSLYNKLGCRTSISACDKALRQALYTSPQLHPCSQRVLPANDPLGSCAVPGCQPEWRRWRFQILFGRQDLRLEVRTCSRRFRIP
jgi:hypothetical protein